MKDKLYKTNRKVGFYRLRNALFGVLFLAIVATAFTLPYNSVVKAFNDSQEKNTPSTTDGNEISQEPVIEETYI